MTKPFVAEGRLYLFAQKRAFPGWQLVNNGKQWSDWETYDILAKSVIEHFEAEKSVYGAGNIHVGRVRITIERLEES